MNTLKPFLVRATQKLHMLIKLEATRREMSMNSYVLHAVVERIHKDQKERKEAEGIEQGNQ